MSDLTTAWSSSQTTGVPDMLASEMSRALASLEQAVDTRDAAGARQAAIDVARWSLDLQLRYRPRSRSTWVAWTCGRHSSRSTLQQATLRT